MIKNPHQIELLETLPYREKVSRLSHGHWTGRKNLWRHSLGDYDYHKITKRILEDNIGNSYDSTYSKYCKKVKPEYRSLFNKILTQDWYSYYIDDNGLIQKTKTVKVYKPVTFYSYDYRTCFVHKQTGEVISKKQYRYLWYGKGNYTEIVISGYSKDFESTKDKEYRKLMRIRTKQYKFLYKRDRKYQKEKQYCFLTKSELQKKKDMELDSIKIESHGFDEESFKGIEYHGQKRKKNKNEKNIVVIVDLC